MRPFSLRLISVTTHTPQPVRHSYLLAHSLLPLYLPRRPISDTQQPIHRRMMNFLAKLTVDLFLADPHGTQGCLPIPTYSKQNNLIALGGAPSVTFGETPLTCYRVPHLILRFTHS